MQSYIIKFLLASCVLFSINSNCTGWKEIIHTANLDLQGNNNKNLYINIFEISQILYDRQLNDRQMNDTTNHGGTIEDGQESDKTKLEAFAKRISKRNYCPELIATFLLNQNLMHEDSKKYVLNKYDTENKVIELYKQLAPNLFKGNQRDLALKFVLQASPRISYMSARYLPLLEKWLVNKTALNTLKEIIQQANTIQIDEDKTITPDYLPELMLRLEESQYYQEQYDKEQQAILFLIDFWYAYQDHNKLVNRKFGFVIYWHGLILFGILAAAALTPLVAQIFFKFSLFLDKAWVSNADTIFTYLTKTIPNDYELNQHVNATVTAIYNQCYRN